VGLQIGAVSIDVVLLVMNERGMEKLLSNKVTLGAEATVAAGPVGRNVEAATDAYLIAEILSYSPSRGLFAGVNIAGGVLTPDDDDNAKFTRGRSRLGTFCSPPTCPRRPRPLRSWPRCDCTTRRLRSTSRGASCNE
jgi:lipid-binding SYLF domain-containing protein